MNIIKKILVAGIISLFVPASSFAEKVKIGDPGWTGATAIANLLAAVVIDKMGGEAEFCLLYTSPSPRDSVVSRMPSSA